MDIEHLTKHQIVLLTLLVSFVTSIATGIVTVSLMNQAPPEVQRTINQIVERTVERVVPPESKPAAVAAAAQKTVVVKDDDLAAQSIAKVRKAVVRITTQNDQEKLIARGVIIDAKGTVLTDRAALAASHTEKFVAILPSGEKVSAVLHAGQDQKSLLATLDLAIGTSTGFAPAALADTSKLQLGQSVIRIGGTGSDTVGTGVIASLPDAHSSLIEASVLSATPGSVLITMFGEVIGLMAGTDTGRYASPDLSSAPPPATP